MSETSDSQGTDRGDSPDCKSTLSRRGGKRAGAGRPQSDSKLYTLRLPGDIARLVDAQPNKTRFIRSCITSAMAGEEPDFSAIGEAYPAVRVKDVRLPRFDIGIVAGFPIPLDNDERAQDIELLRMLCPRPEASYLIRVEGDSMVDAGIYSGDIVIVDKSNRDPGQNEVAVCELNGEYTLKHFVRQGSEGWLIPANPAYPKIRISESDVFRIWGTVTYIIHKPRK